MGMIHKVSNKEGQSGHSHMSLQTFDVRGGIMNGLGNDTGCLVTAHNLSLEKEVLLSGCMIGVGWRYGAFLPPGWLLGLT